ncbi:unnamed protein product [Paramecium sonneborni]|uniref:Uncharacterized protein n=1 Tax=Paramecium sonneborni TaxID=65129 RepID=A0A8S1PMV1_9CILI|nr:unnamed protein product [Paramecium sonneborni]
MLLGIQLANIIVLKFLYYLTINSLNTFLARTQNTGKIYQSLSNTGMMFNYICQMKSPIKTNNYPYFTTQDDQYLQNQTNDSQQKLKALLDNYQSLNKKIIYWMINQFNYLIRQVFQLYANFYLIHTLMFQLHFVHKFCQVFKFKDQYNQIIEIIQLC